MLLLLCGSLCSCRQQADDDHQIPETDAYVAPQDIPFYRHIAWRMDDDTGWYYQFVEEILKDGMEKPVWLFQGINLRYRYHDDYWTYSYVHDKDREGKDVYLRLKAKSGMLWHGEGGKEQQSDRLTISRLFSACPSAIELMRKAEEDRNSYDFETIDRDLFFDLVKEGLSSTACEPGDSMLYWEKPSYAMEVEPEYIDGYKFQVCFVMRAGQIGEIYIDVLYSTGDAYNDYVQLSDLIDDWKADEGQYDAFELLQKIRNEIKKENSFLAFAERYKNRTVGEINFARLYSFLCAIHLNDDAQYNNVNEKPPYFIEEISKEEFEAAGGQ